MNSLAVHPIGVFDSGVGGVSVLCTLRKLLPGEQFVYYADSANAPYGTQSLHAVKNHTFRVTHSLLERNVKAIVVACNTATSAAISDLRQQLSIPVVGMEPALKPAVERYSHGTIIVMATPLTLREKKFGQLLSKYSNDADIRLLPSPRLVELVEAGKGDSEEVTQYLESLFTSYIKGTISAVVLGCTHFLFAKPALSKLLGNDTVLVDGNEGTARRLEYLLNTRGLLLTSPTTNEPEFLTSGDSTVTALCRKLYHWGLDNL